LAVFSIDPHDGAGGCWPRPRKDRLASAMMAVATVSVACTTSGAKMFGVMWRSRISRFGTPTARAPSTKSSVFTASTWPRVRRTKIGTCERPIAIMAFVSEGPSAAASAMARIRKGTASKCVRRARDDAHRAQPPNQPATSPIGIPTNSAMKTETTPA
jgi:hypothetical protein